MRTSLPALRLGEDVAQLLRTWFSAEHLDRIRTRLAIPPAYTTVRVHTLRTSRPAALAALNAHFAAVGISHRAREHPVIPDALVIDIEGPKALPSLEIVPRFDPDNANHPFSDEVEAKVPATAIRGEVLVDRKCGEAVLRGANVFAPGVRGASRGLLADDLVLLTVDLDGAKIRGSSDLDDIDKVCVGIGRIHKTRGQMFNTKSGIAVTMVHRLFDGPPMNDVLPDVLFLQNISSMVTSHVLAPKPGDQVLDMCSAPGGKTTHLALLMQGKGRVVAIDRSNAKVASVAKLAEEQGFGDVIETYYQDSRNLVDWHSTIEDNLPEKVAARRADLAANKGWRKNAFRDTGIRFPVESFDRILLDPSCTGLGLRPRLVEDLGAASLRNAPGLQRDLFFAAVPLLKTGGHMVYSTCTINPLENEEVVAFVLKRFPELQLEQQPLFLGQPGLHGVTGLTAEQAALVQRFDPSAELDSPGFFCARFVKVASCDPSRYTAACSSRDDAAADPALPASVE